MTGSRRVMVVALGNPDRGDDGAGLLVAAGLSGRLPPEVALVQRSGDMLTLIEDWDGYEALICVDAAALMDAAGAIHRIDLALEDLPRDLSFMSSHAFGLPEALALAKTLGLAPSEIIVYAIEGERFDIGTPVSEPVKQAAAETATRILAEVKRIETQEMEAPADA